MVNIKLRSFLILIFILLISTTAINAASYTIQTGYFSQENNALNLSQKIRDQGLTAYKYQQNNRYFVFVGQFSDYNSAKGTLTKVKQIVPEAYIRKLDFNFTGQQSQNQAKLKEDEKKEKTVQIEKENKKEDIQEVAEQATDKTNTANQDISNKSNTREKKESNKQDKNNDVKKDLNYYKNNNQFEIKTASLIKNKTGSLQFQYPNGKKVTAPAHIYSGDLQKDKNYYLVAKGDRIINIFASEESKEIFYTLKDFGYQNDITLKGWQNSFVINIPLSSKVIEDKMYLKLNLSTSEFIGQLSNIDIIINNQTVKSYNFKKEKNRYSLVFPLKVKDINNLKIELNAQLRNEKEEYSKSLYENMWVKIKNSSGIGFNLKNNPIYKINNFFGIEAKKINLYYAGKLSRQEFRDYIKVYTNLNRLFRALPPEVELKLSRGEEKLNNLDNRIRNIVISEDYSETTLKNNLTLYLASNDIDFIFSDFINLTNTNFLNVTRFNLKENVNYKLSTYQDDFLKAERKGWGEINYHYQLPINLFENWPRDLNLHLTGSYFIPFANPAYLKVYINNKMVYSERLKNSSYFKDKLITIPGSELEQLNNLKIQFSQYPAQLLDNYSNLMETYLNPDSYFTVAGSLYKDNSFKNLLHNFKGEGQILIDENSSNQLLKSAALLYGSMHIQSVTKDNFKVDYLTNYDLASRDEDNNWYLIMGDMQGEQPVSSKLAYENNKVKIKKAGQTVIEFGMEGDLSYLDLISHKDKPVMLLKNLNNTDQVEEMVNKIIEQGGVTTLTGDLLIYNGESVQTYQISEEERPAFYEEYYNQLKSTFNQYRRYFYLAAVILFVLILIWIYYRTSHKNISES